MLAACAANLGAAEGRGEHHLAPGHAVAGIHLNARAHGKQAIKALGRGLADVAAAHHMSEAALRVRLEKDPELWVDRSGRLHHVCAGLAVPEAAALPAGSGDPVEAPAPLAQTFLLHSRPSASRKIYLDFDGHITSNTGWNAQFTGGADIVSPPFDIDGNNSSFSNTELERIQYIWQRVSEDYAPFDVDITTEDPGAAGLARTEVADSSYGIRCVITTNTFYSSAGGVAFLYSFSWSSDTPCFVFENALGNGYEHYTAEAISHEVGHSLGLSHDGSSADAYYLGQGSGPTSWAPIMGAGYYKSLTQFSQGEYSDANNQEDDLAIITSYNGFGYCDDDHGDDQATATTLTPMSGAIMADGLIEDRFDVDVFSFSAAAGPLGITINPDDRCPNLDILAELRDGSGALIASSNPIGALDASIDATVAAGTYTLHISGVGEGSATGNGYSDYASIGRYAISGTLVENSGQAPLAQASADISSGPAPLAVSFSSQGSSDSDGSIVSYAWDFGDGESSNEASPSHSFGTVGSYEVILTVGDDDGLSDSTSLTITVNPELIINRFGSLSRYQVLPYGESQAGDPLVSSEDEHQTLRLTGNGWCKLNLGSLDIGPDTVLEFDFSSSSQGEIHGIGFDNDDVIGEEQTFALYGSQTWGIQDHKNYVDNAPNSRHYRIPVGRFFTGNQRYLIFANDHDVNGSTAESRFANIVIHEYGDAPVAHGDSYSSMAGNTITIARPGVLFNDYDAEGGDLTAILISDVSHGILSLASDGSFTYQAESGFIGSDSFIYQSSDGYSRSEATTVTLTITPNSHRRISISCEKTDIVFDITSPSDGPLANQDGDVSVFDELKSTEDHQLVPVELGDG